MCAAGICPPAAGGGANGCTPGLGMKQGTGVYTMRVRISEEAAATSDGPPLRADDEIPRLSRVKHLERHTLKTDEALPHSARRMETDDGRTPKLKPDDGGSHTTAGKDLRAEKTGGSVRTLPAGQRQLFLDESFLASSSGVSVTMKPLHIADDRINVVLRPEPESYPWEGARFNYYHSLVDNGTHVLLYYDVLSSTGPVKDDIARATCLAVSSDRGETFTRPNLGLVAFNGSTDNNIVWPLNKTGHSPGTVFLDEDAPAAERFKMIALWSAPYTHIVLLI